MARTVKDPADITIEEFDAVAARAGLALAPEERQRMYDGYKGLQTLLARLPGGPAMEDEPAVIALVPGTKVVR
jgi:hypothetical protein